MFQLHRISLHVKEDRYRCMSSSRQIPFKETFSIDEAVLSEICTPGTALKRKIDTKHDPVIHTAMRHQHLLQQTGKQPQRPSLGVLRTRAVRLGEKVNSC